MIMKEFELALLKEMTIDDEEYMNNTISFQNSLDTLIGIDEETGEIDDGRLF